jgi:hypothetical protein
MTRAAIDAKIKIAEIEYQRRRWPMKSNDVSPE